MPGFKVLTSRFCHKLSHWPQRHVGPDDNLATSEGTRNAKSCDPSQSCCLEGAAKLQLQRLGHNVVVYTPVQERASVVVNYGHNPKPAADVVDYIKSLGRGDVIDGGKFLLNETLRIFGRLDILILNAGIMGSRALPDVDEAFFDAHFDANVKVPLFLVKEAVKLLPAPGGWIVFFSTSLTAASSVLPNALCYVTSKGAVEQIVRVLLKDLGQKGITVNTISPSPVDSPRFREGKPQHVIDTIAAQNPSHRLANPEDIAPVNL
ncbi:hypothetical protein E1B28_005894 [Marasmius oreades]|uniref:NAD(P)-binding protein n=1 Tax=Marasmius oreades TaxID=181124 RepID=A0A9P7S449_9AGAR|nr:uncharacterized protein E1B28_005894 [Marasmius oreades]KAG7095109.1 hypothetical protein E1B28_005894 [Marasmius oreades]